MNNNKTITILTLVAVLTGGVIIGQLGDEIQPTQINKITVQDFDVSLQELKDTARIVTSTDKLGRVYKKEIRVPVSYLFPVASTSDTEIFYEVVEQTGEIVVSLTGFRNCLQGVYGATTTKPYCLREYVARTYKNELGTFRDSVKGQLNKLKNEEFEFNITVDEIQEFIE